MIDNGNIAKAIEALGLRNTDVCIHASMRAFGDRVDGGAEGIVSAFLAQGCTILVPTFSDMYETAPVAAYMPPQNGAGDYSFFLAQEYNENKTYHVQSKTLTIEEMGIFPKAVLEWEGRIRGNNPLNSFTALGKNAARLVENQTCRDVYAPLRQLYDDDGYVLLMGVSLNSVTAIHFAEQLAGRTPFVRWAKDAQSKTIPVSAGSCSEGFHRLYDALREQEKRTTVGKSVWSCYRAKALVDTCVKRITQQPDITHCGDPLCHRCNDAVKGGPILSPQFWEL